MLQRRHRVLAQNIQNLLNFRPGDVFFEDSGKTDDRKCTHAQSENTFGCCFKYLTYIYVYIGCASNSSNPLKMNGFKHFKFNFNNG